MAGLITRISDWYHNLTGTHKYDHAISKELKKEPSARSLSELESLGTPKPLNVDPLKYSLDFSGIDFGSKKVAGGADTNVDFGIPGITDNTTQPQNIPDKTLDFNLSDLESHNTPSNQGIPVLTEQVEGVATSKQIPDTPISTNPNYIKFPGDSEGVFRRIRVKPIDITQPLYAPGQPLDFDLSSPEEISLPPYISGQPLDFDLSIPGEIPLILESDAGHYITPNYSDRREDRRKNISNLSSYTNPNQLDLLENIVNESAPATVAADQSTNVKADKPSRFSKILSGVRNYKPNFSLPDFKSHIQGFKLPEYKFNMPNFNPRKAVYGTIIGAAFLGAGALTANYVLRNQEETPIVVAKQEATKKTHKKDPELGLSRKAPKHQIAPKNNPEMQKEIASLESVMASKPLTTSLPPSLYSLLNFGNAQATSNVPQARYSPAVQAITGEKPSVVIQAQPSVLASQSNQGNVKQTYLNPAERIINDVVAISSQASQARALPAVKDNKISTSNKVSWRTPYPSQEKGLGPLKLEDAVSNASTRIITQNLLKGKNINLYDFISKNNGNYSAIIKTKSGETILGEIKSGKIVYNVPTDFNLNNIKYFGIRSIKADAPNMVKDNQWIASVKYGKHAKQHDYTPQVGKPASKVPSVAPAVVAPVPAAQPVPADQPAPANQPTPVVAPVPVAQPAAAPTIVQTITQLNPLEEICYNNLKNVQVENTTYAPQQLATFPDGKGVYSNVIRVGSFDILTARLTDGGKILYDINIKKDNGNGIMETAMFTNQTSLPNYDSQTPQTTFKEWYATDTKWFDRVSNVNELPLMGHPLNNGWPLGVTDAKTPLEIILVEKNNPNNQYICATGEAYRSNSVRIINGVIDTFLLYKAGEALGVIGGHGHGAAPVGPTGGNSGTIFGPPIKAGTTFTPPTTTFGLPIIP